MSSLSWNYQGLGLQRTIQALKKFLRAEELKFVFLMKTKLHCDVMSRLKHLGYTHGVVVSSDGNSRGLALLWKPGTEVQIRKYSQWYIEAFVDCENNGDLWRLTGLYGHFDTSKREETWTLLESLSGISNLLWLCIGDFNEIMSASEKEMGNIRPLRQMTRFQNVINRCGFIDLGYWGSLFTWFKI